MGNYVLEMQTDFFEMDRAAFIEKYSEEDFHVCSLENAEEQLALDMMAYAEYEREREHSDLVQEINSSIPF